MLPSGSSRIDEASVTVLLKAALFSNQFVSTLSQEARAHAMSVRSPVKVSMLQLELQFGSELESARIVIAGDRTKG